MVFFLPIKLNNHINIVENNESTILPLNLLVYESGVIKPPTPNIKKRFNIQDPTMFPTAKSVSFFATATIDVTNSGKLVPIDSIVRPITL